MEQTNPSLLANPSLLEESRSLIRVIASAIDAHFSIRLWDGSVEPLGKAVRPDLIVHITSPGVLPSLIRWPSLDRLIRHHVHGRIEIEGGTLLDLFGPFVLDKGLRDRLSRLPKGQVLKALLRLLPAHADHPDETRVFDGLANGLGRRVADNKRFIQFHYDVGNDFYQLFLDPEMQYSCAYFEDWEGDLEQAQRAKLDHICRKLRLKPGERLLDIGCGWGGLLCHAAREYGVTGHGVTLSEAQHGFAQAKIDRLGLGDTVSVEIKDFNDLDGSYDKIVSVGMYEHIGLANIPTYFKAVHRLLADDGLFLNHAISREAVWSRRLSRKSAAMKALQRYIFPGGELDDIGRTLVDMERHGFEVQDVENLRRHYQRTCKLWCERLYARREEAVEMVGEETTRIWIGFLAACSMTFQRGSALIFQTLASKSVTSKPTWGQTDLPPTRADLYL